MSSTALCCTVTLLVVVLGLSIATLVVTLQTRSASSTATARAAAPTSGGVGADEAARAAFEKFSLLAGDIAGADHTPLAPGETGRGFGAHLGPLRAARVLAIVNVAMADAVGAGTRAFQPYTTLPFLEPGTSVSLSAAVAVAAHDTLLALYPAYKQRIDTALRTHLASIAGTEAKRVGQSLGATAAATVLALRADDGAAHAEPAADAFESTTPGRWRRDPISKKSVALGGLWAKRVRPFVIERAEQFRAPPPPELTSDEYAMEYYEVKSLGGDGVRSPTVRDEWRTFVGNFWAYDGTPSLCAPGRLYLQMAHAVARQRGFGLVETARMIGTLTIAMADAGLAAWESKYFYSRERPVTAVRTSAVGDGNPLTVGDAEWQPLGAPASNSADPNFTPPFPAYPSGHATFGGAIAQVLRTALGNDTFEFEFVSDEYNGQTYGNNGAKRPYVPRMFASFSEVAEENGQSRMYLGIHWASDKTSGIAQGTAVANYILPRVYRSLTKQ